MAAINSDVPCEMGPDAAPRNRVALFASLGGGAALVGALAYIGIADPHRPGFLVPPCPFKTMTGWDCPACGGLRMTHDLLHGDLAAAVTDNLFLLIGLPALAAWLIARRRLGRSLLPIPAIAVIVIAVIAWTVARNLPGFPLVPTVLDT